jgi:hypothetical protein
MVRPKADLECYDDFIIELVVDKNLSYSDITSRLRRKRGINVNGKTVQR